MASALAELAASSGGCPGTPERVSFAPSSRDFPGAEVGSRARHIFGRCPCSAGRRGDLPPQAAPRHPPVHGGSVLPRALRGRAALLQGGRWQAGSSGRDQPGGVLHPNFFCVIVFIFVPLGRLGGERGKPVLLR